MLRQPHPEHDGRPNDRHEVEREPPKDPHVADAERAHEALVEAETGLARALGFVPRESPPPETTAFDEDPACPDA